MSSPLTLQLEPAKVDMELPSADAAPIVDPEVEERGRLKRRRLSSVSPRRASSPSRGHERKSGSRYRHHYRKHHRPSSPSSSISPPSDQQKRSRRRSDAEPDHTFRGRARNRSGSRGRTRSPILEDEGESTEEARKRFRKRSAPPSRKRANEQDGGARRQRSYPNLYKEKRRDSKGRVEAEVTVMRVKGTVEVHGMD